MPNMYYMDVPRALMRGEIDFETDDIRAFLTLVTSTVIANRDDIYIADIDTLDEYDGVGYLRIPLTGKSVVKDTVNDLVKFTSDPVTFPDLSLGGSNVYAITIFKFVTNDADSRLIASHQPTGFPGVPNGADFTINPPTNGWFAHKQQGI